MKETLRNNWPGILTTVAGVAIVFGLSMLLFAPDNNQIIPDPDPEVIERDTFRADQGAGPSGSGTPSGPVIISPATINVENASPGLQLPEINVQNQSSEPRRVRIDFAPFYRTTNLGTPVILTDQENIARGRQLVRTEPAGVVTIAAGETLPIRATLISAPPQPTLTGSVGVTLLGRSSPLSEPEKSGVKIRVEQNVRLSALLYAVFPGGSSRAYRVENLRAEPLGAPGRLRVTVEMRSDGDLPASAGGEVILRQRETGQTISRQLPEVVVLPGQRATSSTEAFSEIAPGSYTIEARVRSGTRGQSLSRSLLIDSQGQPAVAESTSLFSVAPRQAPPGGGVELSLRLRNTGEKAFQPAVRIQLFPTNSTRAQAKQEINLNRLAPGAETARNFSLRAPERPGSYIYTATIVNQSGEILEERNAALVVSSAPQNLEPGIVVRFRDWLSEHPGAGMAIGAILTGALLLFLVLALRLLGMRKNKD